MITDDLKTVNIGGHDYITVKQYADRTGVTTSAVYQKIKRDKDGTGFRQYHYIDDDGTQYIDARALEELTPRTNKELTRLVSDRDEQIANLDYELMLERDRYNELTKTFDRQTELMNQTFETIKQDNERKQEQIESLTGQVEELKTLLTNRDNQIEKLTQSLDHAIRESNERYAESNRIHYATATANNQKPGMFDRWFKRRIEKSDVL